MAFGTLLITLFYLILLRCLTGIIVYLSIVAILAFGFAFTGWNIWKYTQLNAVNAPDATTSLWIGIGAGVTTLLYMCCICCVWSSIFKAVAIIKCSSAFLTGNCHIGLVPLFNFFIAAAIVSWFVTGTLFLYGTGIITYTPGSAFPSSTLGSKENLYWWLLAFGLLWVMIWFSYVQNFIFAATTCQWYFYGGGSSDSDNPNSASVCSSLWWAFRYHVGTIAVASLLVTIVTIIKYVFEYFAAKL
jgi:hypothetical protein